MIFLLETVFENADDEMFIMYAICFALGSLKKIPKGFDANSLLPTEFCLALVSKET